MIYGKNLSLEGVRLQFRYRYINLKKLSKWIRLPDIPVEYRGLSSSGTKAVVYDDYAWIFNGLYDILRFDMISESWDHVTTTFSSRKGHKWPYTDTGLQSPSISLLDHNMYVFGGDIQGKPEGSDVFMVLDLKSLQWRYLGDSSVFKRSNHIGKHWPPPRHKAGCWIVPQEKRFYLMYGTRSYERPLKRNNKKSPYDPYTPDAGK